MFRFNSLEDICMKWDLTIMGYILIFIFVFEICLIYFFNVQVNNSKRKVKEFILLFSLTETMGILISIVLLIYLTVLIFL